MPFCASPQNPTSVMKSTVLASLSLVALGVTARPTKRYSAINDTIVLNYALTLEHLEDNFYSGALAMFDEKAFADAGLPSGARGRFVEISAHEKTHVEFLTQVLGTEATQPCTYSFPYTDPKSFAALSQTLEGVGTSAYAGAAQLITNKNYLTAAATILSTEARHSSWVASAVNGVNPWSEPFDVPLSMDEVFSLAATFIVSCPSTNPTLPVKAFPNLTFPTGALPGQNVTLTFDRGNSTAELFVAFYTGLNQEVVTISIDNSVIIPKDLNGTVYAVVSTNGTMASDATILAGPAELTFSFNSTGMLIQ